MKSPYMIDFSTGPGADALAELFDVLRDNRGLRAALRRASGPETVFMHPEFHRFRRRLSSLSTPFGENRALRLAVVVAALAEVKADDSSETFGKQCVGDGQDRVPVSALRYRRFLQIEQEDFERLLATVRRFVRMLDGRVNIADLASTLLNWNDRTRRRLAEHYFEVLADQDA